MKCGTSDCGREPAASGRGSAFDCSAAFMTRKKFRWLLLASYFSAVALMTSASTNDSMNGTGDLVIFFKRAISAPPDKPHVL
jgi:hypothetical protein